MLHRIHDLIGHTIAATDGELGRVKDQYFDDKTWVVRYLVVNTGSWLSDRKVLVSPIALGAPNWDQHFITAQLTREQVRDSPGIDTNRPVSRQHEHEFSDYYGYPYYWGGAGAWGAGVYPGAMLTGIGYGGAASERQVRQIENERLAVKAEQQKHDDPNLRSCKAVSGYHVEASDGDIGHVQDMLIDDETWTIRYLIVNTSNWWLGHHVLVAPEWITDVRWLDHKVAIDLTRQAIKDCPPYDPDLLPDRSHEDRTYRHYGRDGYWPNEESASTAAKSSSAKQ